MMNGVLWLWEPRNDNGLLDLINKTNKSIIAFVTVNKKVTIVNAMFNSELPYKWKLHPLNEENHNQRKIRPTKLFHRRKF